MDNMKQNAEFFIEFGNRCKDGTQFDGIEFFNEISKEWVSYYPRISPGDQVVWYGVLYRYRPRTININGYDVPEPLRTAPPEGTEVYFVSTVSCEPIKRTWKRVNGDSLWLKRGLLHKKESSCRLHIDALLSFTRQEDESEDE